MPNSSQDAERARRPSRRVEPHIEASRWRKEKLEAHPELLQPFEFAKALRQIARNLKACRDHRGMSQADLAKLARMHQPAVARLEAGSWSGLNMATVFRLALGLGVTPSRLLAGVDE